MKIFIQGRKDGYNVLYPAPTPTEFYQFACDIQRIDAENNARYYGQSLYAIAFTKGGCIFAKYVMGYDVQRGNLGSIGISFFILNTQKMMGADVKELLDKLVDKYRIYYYPNDYYINNKQEDWQLFTKLASDYDDKLRTVSDDDVEDQKSGTQEAAFVYYQDENELQRYFDAPYQDEYSPFKQVFFVKSDLQGKPENPLNALRHSKNNLTGQIDLDNPKYKLLFNHYAGNGLEIDVKADGNTCSNKNRIRRKQELEISYSKPCFNPKTLRGKWCKISDCVIVDDNRKTVTIREINLQAIEKTIALKITDRSGNPITNAEITCKSNNFQPARTSFGNQITFKGDELKARWFVLAKKGDFFSADCSIIPQEQTKELSLLLEYKKVKIIVTDQENGGVIEKFNVYVTRKNFYEEAKEIVFVGDEIDKTWNIKIEKCPEYSDSEYKTFCPDKDGNEIYFKLKKKPTKESERKPAYTPEQITTYVEGDLLSLETLNDYKINWKKQRPKISKKDGKFRVFFGGKSDSIDYKNWDDVVQSIKRAIKKRNLINKKNFAELKKQDFSEQQKKFKDALDKIDSVDYKYVSDYLGDVSAFTLSHIAESINSSLTCKKK
ncbi:MAG: hypothetical protein LBQ73_02940 [Tannerellaceae bacterium]|jgi:hypothetical protein|nr:hypothetical protein [Tannerellaceae bacterium]